MAAGVDYQSLADNPYFARNLVNRPCPAQHAHMHGVQIGMREIPQFDRTKIVQVDSVHDRISGQRRSWNALRTFGEHSIALAEINLKSESVFLCVEMACIDVLNEAIDI